MGISAVIERGFMSDSAPLPTSVSHPALPHGVNPAAIAADLQKDGVSATPQLAGALRERVYQAHSKGIDLKIVYYPGSDKSFTATRNLAELLKPHIDGTIVVLNDEQIGSVSPVYPRYVMEHADIDANRIITNSKPPYTTQQVLARIDTYIHDVAESSLNWTPIMSGVGVTVVLTITVIATIFKRKLSALSSRITSSH